jgi:hypothetical protein
MGCRLTTERKGSTASFDSQQFRYGVSLEVLEKVALLEGINDNTTTAEVRGCPHEHQPPQLLEGGVFPVDHIVVL